MSKCLLFSDWLTSLGGGERYLFAVAEALAADNDVTIAAPNVPSRHQLAALGFPSAYPLVPMARASLPRATAEYDLFVHMTTRLPMPSRSTRSFAIVQFPVDRAGWLASWLHPRSRLRAGSPRATLAGYQFIVYSEFVKRWLGLRWGVPSTVLTPPLLLGSSVPLGDLLPGKSRQILSVSRFVGDGSVKRQDVLVDTYKRLPASVQQDWPLVLAGVVAADDRSRAYLKSLQTSASGHNIRFALDQSPADLDRLYRAASLFWHAAGYGRSSRRPQLAEHFGMVTVEAMSRAAVPIVYGDGGQREILERGGGLSWSTTDELVDWTVELATDPDRLLAMQHDAHESSLSYSHAEFCQRARQLLLGDEPTSGPSTMLEDRSGTSQE